ncbi:pyridoxal kinase-like isoform X2 [Gigantopelta aegis]|uniref:pyridoxal kinase-like isoform X2 n=1 Tax=Gigantopelta aegis TaxID=1735272 RepID=UPI001B88C39B|nr:pyridoxal kinase-like isoform X2 [Gigantopelta aegis]
MYADNSVLSIQSSVVWGYVGNKSATFPLQLLGFDVSNINSVQFSNHTSYKVFRGQVLDDKDVSELYDGLKSNNLLDFSHILTGYVGSKSFLEKVAEIIKDIRSCNPNLVYVCDPVMGDNGKMYVPEDLLPVYRDLIIPLADIITPNQFELELVTGITVKSAQDAIKGIDILHGKGVKTVVLSSGLLADDGKLMCIASTDNGSSKERYKIEIPYLPEKFVGTGDLFAAAMLAWMHKDKNLKLAFEKTLAVVQAVIKRTVEHAKDAARNGKPSTPAHMELRLIQSKSDIENPNITYTAVPIS